MNPNVIIETKDLKTGYESTTVVAVQDLFLEKGKLYVLIGLNGSGKSTLIKTLGGLLPPIDGEVKIEGNAMSEFRPGKKARKISIVLTGRPRVDFLTVKQLVLMGRYPHHGWMVKVSNEDNEIAESALQQAGATYLTDRQINSLSDGEFQRVMIARCLAQHTPVILLDEPASFLDFIGKEELYRLLKTLCEKEGKTILISTHDIEKANELADAIVLIKNGKAELHSGVADARALF